MSDILPSIELGRMSKKISLRVDDQIVEIFRKRAGRRFTTLSKELNRALMREIERDTNPEIATEEAEQRLSAQLLRIEREISSLNRRMQLADKVQHHHLAVSDGLVRLIVSLIPEPANLDEARTNGVARYGKFIAGLAHLIEEEKTKQ